jgi:peptidoglycan/LPS O-acetylase OafA/YrhL
LHFPIFDAVTTWLVVDWDRTPWFLLQFFVIMLPLSVWSFERFEQPLRAALLERFRIGARRPQTSRTS